LKSFSTSSSFARKPTKGDESLKGIFGCVRTGKWQPGVNNFVEDHRRQKPESIQLDLILA